MSTQSLDPCKHVFTPPTASVKTTVFKASGLYAPSPGLSSLVVECWGGGGGGGNAAAASAEYIVAGGGGGSGGYSRVTLQLSQVLGGVVVTIGAGGPSDSGASGTSFGALCVANGGGAGVGNNGETLYGGAGPGAAPGIGDVTFGGAVGDIGALQIQYPSGTPLETNATGGLGGVLMGGNQSLDVGVGNYAQGPNALPNTGAGGTGACINQSTHNNLTVLGGEGGSGLCIVTEYIVATGGGEPSVPTFNVNARVKVAPPGPPWPPKPPHPGPCGSSKSRFTFDPSQLEFETDDC